MSLQEQIAEYQSGNMSQDDKINMLCDIAVELMKSLEGFAETASKNPMLKMFMR